MTPARPPVLLAAALGSALLLAWTVASWAHAAGRSGAPVDGALPAPTAVRTPPPAPEYEAVLRRSDGGDVRALKDGKLSSHLVLLADAAGRAVAASRPLTNRSPAHDFPRELQGMIAARKLRLTASGEVQVYALVDDPGAATQDALERAGARIERVGEQQAVVQAQVPVASLRRIAALPGVRRLRLPDYPVASTGSATSEGDAVI